MIDLYEKKNTGKDLELAYLKGRLEDLNKEQYNNYQIFANEEDFELYKKDKLIFQGTAQQTIDFIFQLRFPHRLFQFKKEVKKWVDFYYLC